MNEVFTSKCNSFTRKLHYKELCLQSDLVKESRLLAMPAVLVVLDKRGFKFLVGVQIPLTSMRA